jgi:quinol monooxygenase YgiN
MCLTRFERLERLERLKRLEPLAYNQFEVFQSGVNPDKLTLLERWTDQEALDAHARLQKTRPPLRPELRAGTTEREDYAYNRTR